MRKSLLVLVVLVLATVASADVEVLNTGWGDLSIAAAVQFRFNEVFNTNWTYDANDQTWSSVDTAAGDLNFQRAFFDLKGSITKYWSFMLRVNVLGNNDLNKYYASFKPVDLFKLHFGRLQTPFSFETQIAGTKMDFVANSLFSGLNPGIKDGAMAEVVVDGSEKGTFYLNLKLGAFNNDNGRSFGYVGGRNNQNIIDYAASVSSMPIPGLMFGGYFYMGNGYEFQPDDANNAYFNTMAYGGGACYNPSFGNIDLKVGGEYAMGTHGFADFDDVNDVIADGVTANDISWMGYYAKLMVGFNIGSDFLDRIEIGGRYEGLDRNTDLDDNGEGAVYIGTNLYFSEGHHAKLQLNYVMDMPENEHTVTNDGFIAQLQLMF